MTELPSELHTLVKRYGTRVLEDAEGLRATLDDFLDEASAQPGDINLLVDAVRFGSLARLSTLIDQGVEPAAATADVAAALAQQRGGDADSAYWASAVLGYAAGLLPAELIPGTWARPSSMSPPIPETTGAAPAQREDVPFGSTASGRPIEAPVDDSATHRRGEAPTVGRHPGDDQDGSRPTDGRVPGGPLGTKNESRPSRSRTLAALVTVVALLAAGIVYLLVTRGASDGEQAMHGSHDVPVDEILPHDVFGHFGGNLLAALGPVCSLGSLPDADYRDYLCPFKNYDGYYVEFNDGDPLTFDANGTLPEQVRHPPAGTIVTVEPNRDQYHAYYMTYRGIGTDGLKNTDDDEVDLTLYDVDKNHAGSATFNSVQQNAKPLTQKEANILLSAIGATNDTFPLPKPFVVSPDLGVFANIFLSDEQYGKCAAAFRVFNLELEHASCRLISDNAVDIGFGDTTTRAVATYRYDRGSRSRYSWTDDTGRSGELVISQHGGYWRLFWYLDNEDSDTAAWGLMSAPTKDASDSDLLSYFKNSENNPTVLPQ